MVLWLAYILQTRKSQNFVQLVSLKKCREIIFWWIILGHVLHFQSIWFMEVFVVKESKQVGGELGDEDVVIENIVANLNKLLENQLELANVLGNILLRLELNIEETPLKFMDILTRLVFVDG